MTSKELYEKSEEHELCGMMQLAHKYLLDAYKKREQEIKQAIDELQIWDGIHIADGDQVYKWHDVNELKLKIEE